MKIYTSYFYNIRFLKPYQIPLSTAIWDPKWFHNGLGNSEVFLDKNGVINGLRLEELNPGSCHADGCPCKEKNYLDCWFLKSYRAGLRNIDFKALYEKLETFALGWKEIAKFEEEPEIILIVYETPGNPCSERVPIQEWFAENGIKVEELCFT